MTGVSECSQQRGNLKDDGYMPPIMGAPFSTVMKMPPLSLVIEWWEQITRAVFSPLARFFILDQIIFFVFHSSYGLATAR
ncbi:hypothetical protein [Photorhabdus bodei]|uniref:hypothetical protein n=1 Tax=Photorhabdus bodei TaxID=2029681 RepID=UPI001E37A441|nr:hypothetical protein [Photorhabdus bodei]MCC8465858.1 hypothetical protein [Photorhabdus bodei]